MVSYKDSLPDYGDLMTVDEFKKAVACGAFVDCDGYGHPSNNNLVDHNIHIFPSQVADIPNDATHIVWFNR